MEHQTEPYMQPDELDDVFDEEGEPTAEDAEWIDTGTFTGAAARHVNAVAEGREPESLAEFMERTDDPDPVAVRSRERWASIHHWDDLLSDGRAAVHRLARSFQERGMSAKAAWDAARGRDRHRET